MDTPADTAARAADASTSDGLALAGLLYRPAGPPRGALLVCHGAGSRKENHALMGEQAAAAGLAALTFDVRGHGESPGVLGPDGVARRGRRRRGAAGRERGAVARGARRQHGRLLPAARGAGAPRPLPLARPAVPGGRRLAPRRARRARGEREAGLASAEYSGRFDAAALRPFLRDLDLVEVARGMPRVLLAHARDDEAVPFAHSERLARVLAPPTRFIVARERRPPRAGPLAGGRGGHASSGWWSRRG